MNYRIGERKYAVGEMCDKCGKSQKINRDLCQICYNKTYLIEREKKIVICNVCEKEKSHYCRGMCQSCYSRMRYLQKNPDAELAKEVYKTGYVKNNLPNCLGCGGSFDGEVKRSSKNLCRPCYYHQAKARASKNCVLCGTEMNSVKIRAICEGCKPSGKRKNKLSKPNLKQKQEMKIFLVKAKWGYLDYVDPFRIVHLYLQVVYQDDRMNKFSEGGTIQFCLKRFQEWLA